MRISQANVVEAVQAAQQFLDAHRGVLAGFDVARARRGLDQVAAQLEAHVLAQAASTRASRQETARQRKFRIAIRQRHMQPIAAIARGQLREQPEFGALTMPRYTIIGFRFVTAATDMAAAAEAHAATFVEQGLATDFVASFRAATEQLASSLRIRSEMRGRHIGATAGLASQEKEARAAFRILDALVRPALGDDDALLGEWKAARSIARRGSPGGRSATSPREPAASPGAAAA